MEDPTQPVFPVSEPESISAPQEPVIVTDPTPHTKKKKHNGDCMGMQLLLTGILAAAVFSLRWVNASYQTALLQLYQTHFQAPAEPLLATAVGAAGILGALNVLSANWQCDGANYRSISGDFSVVVCLFGFCLAAACLWSMLAA